LVRVPPASNFYPQLHAKASLPKERWWRSLSVTHQHESFYLLAGCVCGPGSETDLPSTLIAFNHSLLITMLTGIILLILTTGFFLLYVYEMFINPEMQFRLMVVGLLFALLWLGYFQLPPFVRKSIKKRIWKKNRK
jgi:hypothetical protein